LSTLDGSTIADFARATLPIWQAAWDPKGRYVAFVDNGRHLFLWQPAAATSSFAQVDLPTNATALAISPSGDRIAVGGGTGVIVFSIKNGK